MRFARQLHLETLENRLPLAFSINANNLLYEGGSSYQSTTWPIKTEVSFGGLPTPPFTSFSFVVTINAQIDSYRLYTSGTVTEVNSDTRQIVFGAVPSSPAFSIEALQDEAINIPNDSSDFADDTLSIHAALSYKLVGQSNLITESQDKSITIIDNDHQSELTLASFDSSAQEPNSAFYAPSTQVDQGSYLVSVPPQWRGGSVSLETVGSAIDGSDYTLGLGSGYPLALLTKTGGLYSLSIPSRENNAGYASIYITLTALSDPIETDSGESATLQFSPTIQTFSSTVIQQSPPNILTDNYLITTSGSGTVTIDDNAEGVNLASSPDNEKEYTVSAADMAVLVIRPDDPNAFLQLSNRALYLETTVAADSQSGTKNGAIPGVDYVLKDIATNQIIPMLLVPGTNIYRTLDFSASYVLDVKILVVPLNDNIREDDEVATFTLFSKVTPGGAVSNEGDATVTIVENYIQTISDTDQVAEKDCNCSCACSNGMEVTVYATQATAKVKSSILPFGVASTPGANTPTANIRIGFPLQSDKAVPPKIFVDIDLAKPESHSTLSGSAITSLAVSRLMSFVIDTADSAPGDLLWVSIYIDTAYLNAIGFNGITGNAAGDTVLPLEITAHPSEFPSSATTAQRFSGWLGNHNLVVVNQAQSDLSNSAPVPAATASMNSAATATMNSAASSVMNSLDSSAAIVTATTSRAINQAVPSRENSVGPSGYSVFNLPRAVFDAKFLVPRNPTPLTYVTTTSNGQQVQRVGAAVRYRGEVDVKLGTVLIYPDGSSFVYFDGDSPFSLSTVSGSTVTDRYGDKYVFDSSGRVIERRAADGNASSFTYDASGWIKSMTDASGHRWEIRKVSEQVNPASGPVYLSFQAVDISDRNNPASATNRAISMVWNQTGGSVNGNSGTLVITGIDPDDTGPRKALQETIFINSGSMTRIQRSEIGAAATQWFNFGFSAIAGASVSQPGRIASSVTRQDGAVVRLESPIFLQTGYMTSSGTTLYRTTRSNSSVPVGTNIVRANIDASDFPFQVGLASQTDWNGNRSIFRVDSRGRTLNYWDPIQVESVLRDLLPVGNTTLQNTSFINSLSLDSQVMLDRFMGTTYENLSYKTTRAAANKDNRGVILTGKDYAEPLSGATPDPDNFLRREFAALDRVDGALQTQVATQTYTADKNVASQKSPTLNASAFQYNSQYDILTKSTDQSGTITEQTVDNSNGLVTAKTTKASKSYSVGYNSASPLDANNDGIVSPLDSLLVVNYMNAGHLGSPAPAGPPFYDTNGDGIISPLDSLLVINYLNRPEPKTPPVGYDVITQDTFVYASTNGLPKGLISEITTTSGRSSGDRKTVYEYVNNLSSASHGQVQSITTVGSNGAASETTSFIYDAYGRISKVTYPAGRVTEYFYDLTDRVVAILYPDPDGGGPLLSPLKRFDYNSFGNVIASELITSVVDPSVTTNPSLLVSTLVDGYRYDSLDRLIESVEQRGTTRWYLYLDSLGVLQRTITKATALAGTVVNASTLSSLGSSNAAILNSPVTASPNAPGNSTKYPGLSTAYAYDFNGNTLSVTEVDRVVGASSARVTSAIYDRLNRTIELVDPKPGSGLTSTATDVLSSNGGFKTKFAYDNLGNLIKTVDGLGKVTTFSYDTLNRLAAVRLADGSTTNYSYTVGGSSWTVTSTDAEGRAVQVRSDALGRLATVTGATSAKSYQYWNDGSLRSMTDEAGAVTQYEYDSKGQLTKIITPDNTLGTFTYTVDGLLASQTDPLGRITYFQYDVGGRRIKSIAPDADGSGPLTANYEYYQYDSIGNLAASGNGTNDPTSTTYVASSYPDRYVLDGRFRTVTSYDGRNSATTYAYDNFDNLKSVTTPGSNLTTYSYNALNQLVTETQVFTPTSSSVSRSYSYDGVGNLRSSIDRNGKTIRYLYDDVYRRYREEWLSSGTTVDRAYNFTYDIVGNLRTIDDSLNTWGTDFAFTYDTRNQLQLEQQLVPSIGTSVVFDRDYDAVGNRVASAMNLGGSITASSSLSPTAPSTISGGIPDAKSIFAYDKRHRLTSVKQTSQSGGNAVSSKLATFAYNAASQITDIRRYSDVAAVSANLEVHSRYGFDAAGRLTSITHARSEIAPGQYWTGTATLPSSISTSQIVGAYNLTYDAADRLLYFRSYTDAFRQSYGYTASDELRSTSATAISGITTNTTLPVTETTSFDAAGNAYINNNTTTPSAPSGNQNQVTSDGTYTFAYDIEGNLTQRTRTATGAVTLYGWDHRNRLINVQEKASATGTVLKTVEYVYDWFDRRTLKRLDTNGDGVFEAYWAYINDGGSEVLELEDSDGQGTTQGFRISNRFLHGNAVDMILADEQYGSGTGYQLGSSSASATQGQTLWTLGDQLGSIRDVVDNNGIVRQHLVFSAWGVRLQELDRDAAGGVIASNNAAAIDELFGYTGRDWDADTRLQYNRARWYDPQLKRWIAQDPIGFGGGDGNLYRYAGSSASNGTDPSGLIIVWVDGIKTDKNNTHAGSVANGIKDYSSDNKYPQQGFLYFDFPKAENEDGRRNGTEYDLRVADKLKSLLDAIQAANTCKEPVYVVGFSNGTDIVRLALEQGGKADGVVFLGSAIDRDTDLRTMKSNAGWIYNYRSNKDYIAGNLADGMGSWRMRENGTKKNRSIPGILNEPVFGMTHTEGGGDIGGDELVKDKKDAERVPWTSYYVGYALLGKKLKLGENGCFSNGGLLDDPSGNTVKLITGFQVIASGIKKR